MPKQITFFKNIFGPPLGGETFEIFKIDWDEVKHEWVRDENGPYWGIYREDEARIQGFRNIKRFGEVEDSEPNAWTPETNVVHLEAQGIDLEPIDLGEEE